MKKGNAGMIAYTVRLIEESMILIIVGMKEYNINVDIARKI